MYSCVVILSVVVTLSLIWWKLECRKLMLLVWWPLMSECKLVTWLESSGSTDFSEWDNGYTLVLQKVPIFSLYLNNKSVLKTAWSNKMWVRQYESVVQHLVAVLLRGVVTTCSGGGSLSDKKALFQSDMSQGRNNCPIRVFSLSGEALGCAIDLVDGAQCKCKHWFVVLGFPVNLLGDCLF